VSTRVSLFVTCIVDQVFPQVGIAMTQVLERLDYQVDFPKAQTCCGQPAFNSGYTEEARTIARHFLNVFRDSESIVVPSGSCTSMISHHFADVFQNDPKLLAEVQALEPRVWEFSRFLLEAAGVEDVGARFDGVVTYHDSCHALRELHIQSGPRKLLAKVRGLTLAEMARTKIESIRKTGAATVVSIDSSCLMQLQGVIDRAGLPIRTLHLAEVLASR
jgi:L-lactate dehydrogenase complex protein LldE